MSEYSVVDDAFKGLSLKMSRAALRLAEEMIGKSTLEVLNLAKSKGADWLEVLDDIASNGPRSLRSAAEDAARLGRAEKELARDAKAMNGSYVI